MTTASHAQPTSRKRRWHYIYYILAVFDLADGRELGAGHTQAAGQAHAEVMALRDAAARGVPDAPVIGRGPGSPSAPGQGGKNT